MIENLEKYKCILIPKGYVPKQDVCFCYSLDCEKYHVAYNITLPNKRKYQTAIISLDELSPDNFTENLYLSSDGKANC